MDLNDPKSKPFLNATISHPNFKLKWLTNTEHRELAKKIFLEECRKNMFVVTDLYKESSEDDDFFNLAVINTSETIEANRC